MRRPIGEGAVGRVYEAYDEQRRARVALKTISRLSADNLYLFKNEFRSLAHVSHPNLVRLHELFAEDATWFFTMELIEGQHFDDWIHDPFASNAERLRWALHELSEGVAALHAAGKLHRDLKPSNVLIESCGRVVVLDFGLVVDPEPGGVGQTLHDCSVNGTPAYMAPEQASGQPPSEASDWYSIGVMLFEALTGRLPFDGNMHEILVAKQQRKAPSLRGSCAPADLVDLCDALLARDPGQRPDGAMVQAALAPRSAVRSRAIVRDSDLVFGREPELAALRAAYNCAQTGQPTLALVTGESGIGKSALCRAFLGELCASGAWVLAGRCHERESVPFKGLDSLVDDLSRFLRKLPDDEAAALMPREVYALARLFPVLNRIDVIERAPKKDIVEPQELRRCAFSALCELLARMRDRRPLVLHIDDAQWLDRDARTLLGYLLEQPDPLPVLLVLSYRDELFELPKHGHWQRHTLELGPLSTTAANTLAARWLGPEHVQLAHHVAEQANGNPFFLGVLARQARRHEAGALQTQCDSLGLASLGLAPAACRLLVSLCVAGRPLSIQLALEVASADHADLDALCAQQLVRSCLRGTELSLECSHDRIRTCVTDSLSESELRDAHLRLLSVMRARPNVDPEHLALHAHGARDCTAAAAYFTQAAARASESMAFDQAGTCYARALELGGHSAYERCRLNTLRAEALANAGRGEPAARAFLAAARDADAGHALELQCRAAEHLLVAGHIREGTARLREVLRATGLHLPIRRRAARVALLWERARLRARGLELAPSHTPLSADARRELEILLSAARGMRSVDVFAGATLFTRYTRRALDSGLRDHAARGLAAEAWFICNSHGVSAKPHVEALLERADALALASGRPDVAAWTLVVQAVCAYTFGQTLRCKRLCDKATQMLRERCSGVGFELGLAQQYALVSAMPAGDVQPAAQIADSIDEAWRRGELANALYMTGVGALQRLAQGDAEGVARHIEQAHRCWPLTDSFSWPDYHVLFAEACHGLYTRQPARAFERMQAQWPALEQHGLLRMQVAHAVLRFLRAASAVAVARDGTHVDRAKLTALVQREIRYLRGIRAPSARAYAHLLQSALANLRGRRERELHELRHALSAAEAAGIHPFATAVRNRLGKLVGGEEGARLIDQAEQAASRMHPATLEGLSRLFLFGL